MITLFSILLAGKLLHRFLQVMTQKMDFNQGEYTLK